MAIKGRLTHTETAKEIGVNSQTLYTWRAMGRGPDYYKIGAAVYYSQDDIDTWIEQQRVEQIWNHK